MLLDKLFTPKWKHRNPQVRKYSLLNMDPKQQQTQDILCEVVHNDPELFIRRLAIQRLTDIDTVQNLREKHPHKEIYEEASKRLCELLSQVSEQRSFGQIKSRLDALGEARILEYVAKHTRDEALQKYALEKITNEKVLVDVLLDTQYSDIRNYVLNKLDNINALKRVIKALKRKDKRVAALAQEKLDKLSEARSRLKEIEAEYKRVAQDFLDLFRLCELSSEWPKYEIRLRQLYEQWRGLSMNLNDATRRHYQMLSQQVEDAYKAFEQKLKESAQKTNWEVAPQASHTDAIEMLQGLRDQAQERLQEIRKPVIQEPAALQNALQEFVTTIKQQWQTTYDTLINDAGIALPTADLPQTKSAFEAAVQQLEQITRQLPVLDNYQQQLTDIVHEAQQMLAPEKAMTQKALEQLETRYRKLKAPGELPVNSELTAQYQQAISALREKLSAQEQDREKLTQEFASICRELGDAVKRGRTKHAVHLTNRGKKLLKQLDDKGQSLLDKRGDMAAFQTANRQLQELQDWRQWSNASVKEQLISDMQQLAQETRDNIASADYDFTAAANAIKSAREQWKQLTVGETASDQELWQAFDTACNEAYQPCQDHFEQQGEQRAANLQQREQVCQELETYLETVQHKAEENPADIDWKAMEKIIRTARHDWGQLGMVNRSDRPVINKRFNNALHSLEKLLRNQQQANQESKQALVKRAEYIASQLSDQALTLDQAIEEIKDAQAQWKTIGKAAKEKAAWKQFREACDRVFAVRETEQKAVQEQREQEKQQRLKIIEAVEKVAQGSGDDLLQARGEIEQLKTQWGDLPKLKNNHALERRFSNACRQYDKQLQGTFRSQLREDKQKLQHNVSLCYQLESALFHYLSAGNHDDDITASVQQFEQQWQVIETKLKLMDQAVRDRFQQLKVYVEQAADNNREQVREELLARETALKDQKDNLCIQMEILANVESPPESKQQRMEYQVAQLAERMKERDDSNTEKELENLLAQWHRSGFVNPDLSQYFEQRFYSALRLLDKDYQ
ncbi:MAG: DUF349 domain-containing protein [Gammaproteobacteria bacterium]|jgi:hypothetical protein